ncbi:MAG: LCP family protein [Tissierellaceae bacterium]
MKKRFIVPFIVATIVFSIGYAVVGHKISRLEQLRRENNVFYKDRDLTKDGVDEEIEPLNNDELLFLLAGIDHSNLSDTLILCKVNFKTGEIDLLSIPRDSRVYVNGALDKINHAHGKGGIELTLKTIQDFLDLKVDYYVRADFKAVKAIVDAIGGVKLDVKRDMHYKDTTKGKELFINIKKGEQVLDGDKALEFLRFRRYRDGDVERVQAQQQFMEEFIKQTLQIKNITKWMDILETYYSYVDTNIPISEITKGLKMALKWDKENIHVNTIPGVGRYIGDISYYIVDEEGTRDMVLGIFKDYLFSELD